MDGTTTTPEGITQVAGGEQATVNHIISPSEGQSLEQTTGGESEKRGLTEREEDMLDLELGASLLAAMKRGKGETKAAEQWEAVASTARDRANQERQAGKLDVPNFSTSDGHELSIEEKLSFIEQRRPGAVPKFSTSDGHPLTPEERLEAFKKL